MSTSAWVTLRSSMSASAATVLARSGHSWCGFCRFRADAVFRHELSDARDEGGITGTALCSCSCAVDVDRGLWTTRSHHTT